MPSIDPLPRRVLGRTGVEVSLFGLGGEGILRTYGHTAMAVKVIHRALDQGVTYCDTAPAYADSINYYGAALGERRKDVFLAAKTHDRTRDGSLRLLDDTLARIKTDHLDLWQLHDLRTMEQIDAIFGKGGAMEAMFEARQQKRVRYLGITGHHDPAILLEAMNRFDFDTVLVALNAADVHTLSFINTVLPEAHKRNMGVIGMKVTAQTRIFSKLRMAEAMGYVLSLPGVSNVIIGCTSPAEVDENADIARKFVPFAEAQMRELEARTRKDQATFTYFKRVH
jgi:aryl-alcohol dehydrogenase-like predicted oxidoreductase